jgi:hypothetical protein
MKSPMIWDLLVRLTKSRDILKVAHALKTLKTLLEMLAQDLRLPSMIGIAPS